MFKIATKVYWLQSVWYGYETKDEVRFGYVISSDDEHTAVSEQLYRSQIVCILPNYRLSDTRPEPKEI